MEPLPIPVVLGFHIVNKTGITVSNLTSGPQNFRNGLFFIAKIEEEDKYNILGAYQEK